MKKNCGKALSLSFLFFFLLFTKSYANNMIHLCLIELKNMSDAEQALSRLEKGELFENVARDVSIDLNRAKGGYIGGVCSADLKPEFKKALEGLKEGEYTGIIKTGLTYIILKKLASHEVAQIEEKIKNKMAAGLLGLSQIEVIEKLGHPIGDGFVDLGRSDCEDGMCKTWLYENEWVKNRKFSLSPNSFAEQYEKRLSDPFRNPFEDIFPCKRIHFDKHGIVIAVSYSDCTIHY